MYWGMAIIVDKIPPLFSTWKGNLSKSFSSLCQENICDHFEKFYLSLCQANLINPSVNLVVCHQTNLWRKGYLRDIICTDMNKTHIYLISVWQFVVLPVQPAWSGSFHPPECHQAPKKEKIFRWIHMSDIGNMLNRSVLLIIFTFWYALVVTCFANSKEKVEIVLKMYFAKACLWNSWGTK